MIEFLNPKPEKLQVSACHHIVDLHKLLCSGRLHHFSSTDLDFTMNLIHSKFSMNSLKQN